FESPHAQVIGYEHIIDTIISEGDTYLYEFKSRSGENNISFHVDLSREDYDLFTDIGLQILKPDGSAVFNGAFDLREAEARMTFIKNDTSTYVLKFRGGLANPQNSHPFRLLIRERREVESAKSNDVVCTLGDSLTKLYPAQSEDLTIPAIKNMKEP